MFNINKLNVSVNVSGLQENMEMNMDLSMKFKADITPEGKDIESFVGEFKQKKSIKMKNS